MEEINIPQQGQIGRGGGMDPGSLHVHKVSLDFTSIGSEHFPFYYQYDYCVPLISTLECLPRTSCEWKGANSTVVPT